MDSRLNRRLEIGFCIFLLAVLGILFAVSLGYPSKPRQLPMLVDAIGIVTVTLHLFGVLRAPAEPGQKVGSNVNWRSVFMAFGTLFAYLGLAYFIGMVIPMVALVYGTGIAFGGKNKARTLALALVTTVAIYVVFEVVLGVRLYRGILLQG